MADLAKIIEESGLVYELDEATQTYIPQIEVPEEKPLGRYGRMRRDYLKNHHKGIYQAMLMSGKLNGHCAEIDETANAYLDRIIKGMAEADGLTEDMKNTDQLRWVGLMNNYKHCAEEVIFSELIFVQPPQKGENLQYRQLKIVISKSDLRNSADKKQVSETGVCVNVSDEDFLMKFIDNIIGKEKAYAPD